MAERYECFGLEDLVARPEDAFRLAGLAMTGGQRVRGYRGDYYRYFLGDAQVVVRTMGDPDTGEEQLLGMDVQHAEGRPWECRIIKDVTPEDADPLCRRLLAMVIVYMAMSLLMAVLWSLLQSPDLAITEAAVGAGVTSILFFLTLKRIHALKGTKDG